MAFCRSHAEADDGYALPAAMVMSLALAVLATALMAQSMGALTRARDDFDRLRIATSLESAHVLAASAIVSSQTPGPYRWSVATESGQVEIVAENEGTKLDFASAAQLSSEALARFEVLDPLALKARLAEAAARSAPPMTADLDDAILWKLCAPALISPLGQGQALQYTTPGEPGPGPLPPSWRIGEVWRVNIATTAGWRDNRLVRFTGDASRPSATAAKRFFRTTIMGEQSRCEEIINDIAAG